MQFHRRFEYAESAYRDKKHRLSQAGQFRSDRVPMKNQLTTENQLPKGEKYEQDYQSHYASHDTSGGSDRQHQRLCASDHRSSVATQT